MIALDWETYYSRTHSVSELGPWAYAHHPDTDIYLVSVVGEGISFVGSPKDFDWPLLDGKDLVSHNAAFDMVVARAAICRGVIPQLNYKSWSCSADLMAYVGYPRSLAAAYEQSFGIKPNKLMRNWMSGKRWSDAVAKGKDEELLEYGLRDSEYCLQLWEKHSPAWPEHERWLSGHTRTLIWRGVHLDTEKLDAGIAVLTALKDGAADKIPWKDEGKILSLQTLRGYCAALGVEAPKSLAKDSAECIEWEDEFGDKFVWIGALRDYRRTNMLLKKLTNMRDRVREDGTMPVYLKYWGGHTGRWSGDAGVNIQNLPRGTMFGANLREMIKPRPGYKFVTCDLSQIEPRVLAYLAGDQLFLDQLSTGISLYEAAARSEGRWTGDEPLKTGNPALYQYYKACILGLGFGCGPPKFVVVAKSLADLTLTLDEAKAIVAPWRRRNGRITRFWTMMGRRLTAAKQANKESMEYPLPSGRSVKWWEPRADRENTDDIVVNQTKGTFRNYTWGGKLTENVVQSLARDVFAHHIRQTEAAGLPVVWTVHDEIIVEVPEAEAPAALETLTKIMSTPPPWISTLPLAAEGAIVDCYTK
jgi:hypothetical protein